MPPRTPTAEELRTPPPARKGVDPAETWGRVPDPVPDPEPDPNEPPAPEPEPEPAPEPA